MIFAQQAPVIQEPVPLPSTSWLWQYSLWAGLIVLLAITGLIIARYRHASKIDPPTEGPESIVNP